MRTNFATLLTLVIIIQLYRLYLLLHFQYDLYVDEAYYWGWSKDLAFGYYSKPPMIAWTIALFTKFCGDSLFCIKLPSIVLYPITTIFIYHIAKRLFDEKIAFWSGVAFITLPAVSMSSLIISTDVLLLLFWAAALYFFLLAIENDRWRHWLAAAIAAGFGLLTKYTMIIFIISVFFYLTISVRYRHHLKNPKLYLTALLAALIYIPNLIWNANNHFITFLHTEHISQIDSQSHFHPEKLLEFWAAQMGVFGPIFFVLFLYLLIRPLKEERFKVLYAFTLPFFAIISLQALLSRALANWAAPTYVAATLLVVAYLIIAKRKKLLFLSLTINILAALLFYNYESVLSTLGIELNAKNDPFKRVRGFSELARKVQPFVDRYRDATLLFDDRTTAAELIYYLTPHPFDALYFNPHCTIGNQYALKHDLKDAKTTRPLLFITKFHHNLEKYFKKVTPLTQIVIELYPNKKRIYHLYLLEGFKGYPCEK